MLPVLMDATTTTSGSISPVVLIVYLAAIVLIIAGMWAMFTKAGQPGWAAIIPIYNTIVLLRVAGRPWWWFLLMLIPFVNFVIIIIVYMDLAKAFGGGCGLALGFVLVPFIMYPVIGFGSATYRNPRAPVGYPGQPYPGQPYPQQQYPGQPYQGQPYQGQQYPGPGQQYPTQPSNGQEYPGQQQQYPPQYPPQQ